jgi:hypothetical protein
VNILNRANFNKVWDDFTSANPLITFDNGDTINLLTGPYKVNGFKPTSFTQLSGHPGAFVSAGTPRQIQFGLQVVF